jgi:hypothetical protein
VVVSAKGKDTDTDVAADDDDDDDGDSFAMHGVGDVSLRTSKARVCIAHALYNEITAELSICS